VEEKLIDPIPIELQSQLNKAQSQRTSMKTTKAKDQRTAQLLLASRGPGRVGTRSTNCKSCMRTPRASQPSTSLKVWQRIADLSFNKFINGTGTPKRRTTN